MSQREEKKDLVFSSTRVGKSQEHHRVLLRRYNSRIRIRSTKEAACKSTREMSNSTGGQRGMSSQGQNTKTERNTLPLAEDNLRRATRTLNMGASEKSTDTVASGERDNRILFRKRTWCIRLMACSLVLAAVCATLRKFTGGHSSSLEAVGRLSSQQRNNVLGQGECLSLPFTEEAGTPIDIEDLSFFYANIREYYGLSTPAYFCCASERQLLCTDGYTLIYGSYISDKGRYTVNGRTRHCINSTLGSAYPATSTWGDDSINSDLIEGFVEDRLYVLYEFGLNCSVVGPVHLDGADRNSTWNR